MLSPEAAATVRATLPAVSEQLDTITARFYEAMFTDHPDLLDGMFNRGNQASGEQSKALAASIIGFARSLLNNPDERPDTLLSRIAHKHASLGVTEDQYAIVHKYLFQALGQALGEDAADSETLAAWDEVYWLMAGALIAIEARLYAESGTVGRDVWRPWRVTDRDQQTPDTVSLGLEPEGEGRAPDFRAGQYVSVQVRMPDGLHQARQYSISGWDGRSRRITVKRLRAGEAPAGEVSSLLHDAACPGDTLMVSTPAGDVTVPEGDHPLVLVSAGVGCSPMVAMLHHLVETGSEREVLVLHSDHSPEDHPHRDEVDVLVDTLPGAGSCTWYETGGGDHRGEMDLSRVQVPEDAEVFLCGPLPFMRDVRAQLIDAGVPPRLIHYEVFGPDMWLGAA